MNARVCPLSRRRYLCWKGCPCQGWWMAPIVPAWTAYDQLRVEGVSVSALDTYRTRQGIPSIFE